MNSYKNPVSLTDAQMRSFLTEGFLVLQTRLPMTVHEHIRTRCEAIFTTTGNPGNAILEMNPAVHLVFADPVIRGALRSILGDGFFMHPHRHCHRNVSGTPAQTNHRDSYEEDLNVRHHRVRWAMAMYYPQRVTADMGPTGVTPGSQYFSEPESLAPRAEIGIAGEAGTVIIVHYDLWHRALRNVSGRNRYMLKFLFCRAAEPEEPAWDNRTADWIAPKDRAGDILDPLWEVLWRWYRGERTGYSAERCNNAVSLATLQAGSETERLGAAYTISPQALDNCGALYRYWQQEAAAAEKRAQTRAYTNPCEHVIGYALGALAQDGLGYLEEALQTEDWRIRGCAVDVIGDIGRAACGLAPRVTALLQDASPWVRRNAAETLGVLGDTAEDVTDALGRALADENPMVGHNAALSLRKLGHASEAAIQALLKATVHPEPYRRANSLMALSSLLR